MDAKSRMIPVSDDPDSQRLVAIGRSIKRARERLGMTQHELALAAGTRANTVSRWERGAQEAGANELRRVAEALKTSVDELLGAPRLESTTTIESPELARALSVVPMEQHEIEWISRHAYFHKADARAIIEAVLAMRIGLTPEQASSSAAAMIKHSDPNVPRRK